MRELAAVAAGCLGQFPVIIEPTVQQAISSMIRALQPTEVVSVYTNIEIDHANWIPEGDIHHWYRRFMERMDWTPRISELSYDYVVPSDLDPDPSRSAVGTVAYDVQRHTLDSHEGAHDSQRLLLSGAPR